MEGSVRTASGFELGDGYRSGRCGAGVRNKAQGESRRLKPGGVSRQGQGR